MSSQRAWILGGATFAVGGGLIAWGWLTDGAGYSSSLLQNVGVAVLLLVPLLAIERGLRSQARQTAQESKEVRRDVASVEKRLLPLTSLEDLGDAVADELNAAAATDRQLAEDARTNLSAETMSRLFDRACELNGISEHGLRVVVPHQLERFRFIVPSMPGQHAHLAEGVIRISVEDLMGVPLDVSVDWTPGDDLPAVFASLVAMWKRAGTYPGDHAIDAEAIIDSLIKSLDLAIESRSAGGDEQLSPLIELLSREWALTDFGLEHLPLPYWIRAEELADEKELEDWRRHMREKVWVLEEDERAKAEHEPDFWMVSRIAHQFFSAKAD